MPDDYYEILGVARDATSQDIKKAFRQIARECHPDVSGGDPESEERFKKSRLAYETLMDPVTRARYDRRGQRRRMAGGSFFDAFYKQTGERSNGGNPGFSGNPAGGPPRGSRPKKNDPRNNLGLDDLFNVGEFGFGSHAPSSGRSSRGAGGSGGPGSTGGLGGSGAAGSRNTGDPGSERWSHGGRQPHRPTPGSDVQIDLDVPADVAARGGSVTAVYHRLQRADSWRPGTDDAGLVRVQDIADIRIVPGTRNGTILREKALGDAGPFGGSYGDLIARVRITGPKTPRPTPPPASAAPPLREPVSAGASASRPAADTTVRSDQDEEVATLEINVTEAILGGRVALETPQGKVRLTIPPGTSGGTRLRLKGKGSALPNGTVGDLYVEIRIVVPKTLDTESRRLIEEFAKLNP